MVVFSTPSDLLEIVACQVDFMDHGMTVADQGCSTCKCSCNVPHGIVPWPEKLQGSTVSVNYVFFRFKWWPYWASFQNAVSRQEVVSWLWMTAAAERSNGIGLVSLEDSELAGVAVLRIYSEETRKAVCLHPLEGNQYWCQRSMLRLVIFLTA